MLPDLVQLGDLPKHQAFVHIERTRRLPWLDRCCKIQVDLLAATENFQVVVLIVAVFLQIILVLNALATVILAPA